MWLVFLILGITCIGIYAYTNVAAYLKADASGVNTMKVFSNGSWVEEEELRDQSLVKFDQNSLLIRSNHGNGASSNPGVVDGLKSKLGSSIQKRILEDQAKVTEAQAKAIEAQKKAMEQKASLIETVTKGQRAQNEYELLPKEREVKEIGFDVSKSELQLKQLELEMKRKQLEQQMQQQANGTYIEEPEEVVKLRQGRQETKQASIQVYMSDTEEDSIVSRMQALDAWYDEKTEDIMRNGKLDVGRRRDQLGLLDKEYKLRKKQLDDLIDARLADTDGGIIQI